MALYNWVPPTFGKTKFPSGIILPFLGTTTPAGWADFTAANGKFIVGAGSTYAAGGTGGSTSVALSGSTVSAGAHNYGTSYQTHLELYTTNSRYGNAVAGAHIHTISDSASNVEDVSRTYKLIKASTDVDTLPPEVGVFAKSSLKNLTNIHDTVNRFMKANTTDGTLSGSATHTSAGFTTGSAGGHGHDDKWTRSGDINSSYPSVDSGAHAHTGDMTGTLNTKYFYLSLWNNATKGIGQQRDMIGMWEGSTAPNGWKLCDGNNGAPDLRDFFIKIGSIAQHGTFGGNNTSSWVINSLSSAGAHAHQGGNVWCPNNILSDNWHLSGFAHSNHTASITPVVLPPYYALTFIIKI